MSRVLNMSVRLLTIGSYVTGFVLFATNFHAIFQIDHQSFEMESRLIWGFLWVLCVIGVPSMAMIIIEKETDFSGITDAWRKDSSTTRSKLFLTKIIEMF